MNLTPTQWMETHLLSLLTYFTLDELFCHRRRVDIQADVCPSPSCGHRSLGSPSPCTISEHRLPTDFVASPWSLSYRWITTAFFWGAVGAILLTCDNHLILFLFAVCAAGCMFTRRLMSSFLILSILVFPAAFLRHIISVVVRICFFHWLGFSFHSDKVELG